MQTIAIAPYLHVLVVDASELFRERLSLLLGALDFRRVTATASASQAIGLLEADAVDLVFLEAEDRWAEVWRLLATTPGHRALVIGVCARGLEVSPGYDADAIVARQLYPALLRSMLAHLYASPAARRGRIVPFRTGRPRGGDLLSAERGLRARLPRYLSPGSRRTESSL